MDMKQALAELGARDELISGEQRERLDEDGFVFLSGILSGAQLEVLRTEIDRLFNETEGARRTAGDFVLFDVVNKGRVFDTMYTQPQVLAAIAHVLHHDLKLSSLHAREPQPGTGMQPWHADWLAAFEPGDYQVCNTLWLIDDFTEENGATRLRPGSHRGEPREDMLVIAPAGTVVVFNAHTLHGGTVNRSTTQRRRSCNSFFTRRHQKQQANQKQLLQPETLARLSEAARFILGV